MAFGNFSSAVVSKVRRLTSQIKEAQRERTDGLRTLAQSAEVGGTAFALSFLNGRNADGTVAFHGIPLDLTLAAVAHAIGFSGVLRFSREDDQSYHAHAVGCGALAVYASRMGTALGQRSLQSRPTTTQTTRGELPHEEVTGALPPPRYVHGYPAERWTVRRAA
jgi:hypothetical protein